MFINLLDLKCMYKSDFFNLMNFPCLSTIFKKNLGFENIIYFILLTSEFGSTKHNQSSHTVRSCDN